MTWILATASLTATWLNVRKVRACFAIWFITNICWAAVDIRHGLPAQAALMAVYAALAAYGYFHWGRPDRPTRAHAGGDSG